MVKNILNRLKATFRHIQNKKLKYEPVYRLVEIRENNGDYTVLIHLINKNITFTAKPEEILKNDNLVDQYSPRDIRSLTYLGYLGMNSPKYKILAQRLSQTDKTIFVLKKKGNNKVILKTTNKIVQETCAVSSMNSQDAQIIGYTVATETYVEEQKQALPSGDHLKGKVQLKNKQKELNQ